MGEEKNMTAGTELLRRKADKTGHVITFLITDATGRNLVNLKERRLAQP